MIVKKRLDLLVQERFPALSRTHIQSLIMQGKIVVEGKACTKAGIAISPEASIEVAYEDPQYVCRAGWKLAHALDHFAVDVKDLVVLDAGLSTGGFTDCLLQRGARRVYGVDVGYGQVHEKIGNDPRVVVIERTNLRYLDQLPEKIDLATLDLSFISLTKVIGAVKHLLNPEGQIVALIKPQFEASRYEVGKGGIVRDPAIHQKVITKVTEALIQEGFSFHGIVESPLKGATGNIEFLGYFKLI